MDKKNFLLADDDIDDREMFTEAFAVIDNNIICHCVVNGREALKKLDELPEKPQLIFLDVNMPVMNGWQCLKLLKANEPYRQAPVIIISTSSHQRDIQLARELGALCFFSKPNHFNELLRALQVIVANLNTSLVNGLQHVEGNISRFIYAFE